MRTGLKRLARVGIAFSKSVDNHWHAVCSCMFWCNTVCSHGGLTPPTSPAMPPGPVDGPLDLAFIVVSVELRDLSDIRNPGCLFDGPGAPEKIQEFK